MIRPTCYHFGVVVFSTLLTFLSTSAFAAGNPPQSRIDCNDLSVNTNDADDIAIRLSCYNQKLDGLTQVLSNLILERQRLSGTTELNTGVASNTSAASTAGQQQELIAQLRIERAELRAQLQRLMSENQPGQISKEADEQLFRNYSDAYTALTNENTELRKLLDELQTSTQSLEALQLQKTNRISALDQQIETLNLAANNLSADNVQLTGKLKQAGSQIDNLEQQLRDNTALMQEHKIEISALQHQKEEQSSNIEELNQKIAESKLQHSTQITNLTNDTQTLQARLQTLTKEHDQIRTQAKQAALNALATTGARDREIVALNDEINLLRSSRDEVTEKLTTAKENYTSSSESIKRKILESQQTSTLVSQENIELKEKLATNDVTLKELGARAREKQSAIRDLNEQLAGLQKDVQTARTQSQDLTAELNTSSTNNQNLTDNLSSVSAHLNSIQNERDRLAAELSVARPEIKTLSAKIKTITGENKQLAKQIKTRETDLEQAKSDISALEKQLAQSQAQYSTASDKISKLTQTVGNLESILNESLDNNSRVEASLTAIRKNLNASQERLDARQLELKNLMAEKAALIEARNTLERESKRLADSIAQKLKSAAPDAVEVKILEDNILTLKVGSSQLFRTGSSKLSTEGQAILAAVGSAIAPVENRRILIEGHSDNVPLGAKLSAIFKNNTGLSMARAATTAEFFTRNANIPANKISVSGAGESKPLASNDTAQGRQQNRRVDILLLPAKNGQLTSN